MTPPAPRANPDLFGHQQAAATLREALASNRLHHAWLVTGPPGIGKATFAFRFARDLLGAAPGSPAFARIAAGSHPDLLVVERTAAERSKKIRSEIVMDDTSAIGNFLHLTPAEGAWRVVVIDGAEDLNRNAANSILKMLEEPPARAVLILTCSAPGRLLPTIRSRCRRLALAPLSDAELDAAIAHFRPDLPADQRAQLAAHAQGSVGQALQLAENNGLKLASLAQATLAAAHRLDTPKILATVDLVGREEDDFALFLDLLSRDIAAAIRAGARREGEGGQPPFLAARPLEAWVDVWQALLRTKAATIGAHQDRRQALVECLGLLGARK